MFNKTFSKATSSRKLASGLVATALGLALCTVQTSAFANVAGAASPTVVEYQPGVLLVQLPGGTNYIGVLNAVAGCTSNSQSIDTLKQWTSLAQAALLSGKSVKVFFNVCGGFNYISTIDINQ